MDFIDYKTANDLQLILVTLRSPIKLHRIDRGPIGSGFITHRTPHLPMKTSSLHQKRISFLITNTKKYPIILRQPWLQRHNPFISWYTREIPQWSDWCHKHRLNLSTAIIASTSIESPETVSHVPKPTEYAELHKLFRKVKVSGLPPPRPYDCAIDLLPDTTPPRNRIYPLSLCSKERPSD